MKLAEALILRADFLKRFRQLKERLSAVVKVQEGDEPFENPQDLIRQLEQVADEFADLVKKINKTNSSTIFSEDKTLTDILAERDVLGMKRNMYENLAEEAQIMQNRHSKSEVKFVVTVNIQDMHKKQDALAKAYRELDSKIQQLNWTIDLVE